jgi:adenylate cyclase class 2
VFAVPDTKSPGKSVVTDASRTETEIKLPVADPHAMQEQLAALDFQITKPRIFEANTLYDDHSGGLRARGCIVRLREVGNKRILTFKGPAESKKHKAREELETIVEDGEILALILRRLGFEPVFRYEKYRAEYQRPHERGVVTLDETPVGWFLELEGPPDWIDETATKLGFEESNYLTQSYGSLYQAYCEARGLPASAMVFNVTS